MAEFLTTRGTISSIENIISGAKILLFLVSPYLKPPKVLLEKLRDADGRRVATILIHKTGELDADTIEQLRQFKNLSLHSYENLHAKCYFNEEAMVITSMNFYEASEKNREIGLLIRKAEDEKIFNEAVREIMSI